MAIVQLIDGRIVENARITDVKRVGEEGGRSAIAHIDGHAYSVYYNDVDGPSIWYEQMSEETWQMLKGTGNSGFVEGSIAEE